MHSSRIWNGRCCNFNVHLSMFVHCIFCIFPLKLANCVCLIVSASNLISVWGVQKYTVLDFNDRFLWSILISTFFKRGDSRNLNIFQLKQIKNHKCKKCKRSYVALATLHAFVVITSKILKYEPKWNKNGLL